MPVGHVAFMWMMQTGVFVIWLTIRLLAKGKEEKVTKDWNQKTESSCQLLRGAINIIAGCNLMIGNIQDRYVTGTSITIVRSDIIGIVRTDTTYSIVRKDVMLYCTVFTCLFLILVNRVLHSIKKGFHVNIICIFPVPHASPVVC